MEGRLSLSQKERQKLIVLSRVRDNQMTLAEAARVLGLCYRQAQRVYRRYRSDGETGLVHKGRGKPSGRRIALEIRSRAIELYKDKYADFGPTLASETMADRDGLTVNPETLRLWLIEDGVHTPQKSKRQHRSQRKRKSRFGDLVQMDGSIHDWFEGRAPRCFLMSMVDDATGKSLFEFWEEETTEAAMSLLQSWIKLYGVPKALYVDRKTVYITSREPTTEEQLAGVAPATQFGRACRKLGIELIAAHSPQAKGRVERKHGVCQDRLIKAMRLEGVVGITAGNAFLPTWIPGFNAKFAIEPLSSINAHRAVPLGLDLRKVFCLEEARKLSNDWTVRFENRHWQVLKQREMPAAGVEITVQKWRDGSVHLLYRDRVLKAREIDAVTLARVRMDKVAKPLQPKPKTGTPYVPPANHYWRGNNGNAPRLSQAREEVNQIADRYLKPVSDSL